MNAAAMNTTALAFIGDAVYEIYIRKLAFDTGQTNADRLHRMTVQYVKAEGQALALKEIMPRLTEQETALVKRARNHKTTTKPKNVDPVTYKQATALEALIGYLYLAGEDARLDELVSMAIAAIDNQE